MAWFRVSRTCQAALTFASKLSLYSDVSSVQLQRLITLFLIAHCNHYPFLLFCQGVKITYSTISHDVAAEGY